MCSSVGFGDGGRNVGACGNSTANTLKPPSDGVDLLILSGDYKNKKGDS
jgi:hypothetical protein